MTDPNDPNLVIHQYLEAGGDLDKIPPQALVSYTKWRQSQEPTLMEKGVSNVLKPAAEVVGSIAQKIDPYTFAPARAAMGQAQDADVYEATHDKSIPEAAKGLMNEYLVKPVKAGIDQFGKGGLLSSQKADAPTESQIAAKAGFSTEKHPLSAYAPMMYSDRPNALQMHEGSDYDPGVSHADVAGAAAGVMAPASISAVGLLGRGASKVSGLLSKVPANVAQDVSKLSGEAASLPDKVKGFAAQVPAGNAKVFNESYPAVQALAKKFHDNPFEASEEFRTRALKDATNVKNIQNGKIENFLKSAESGESELPGVDITGPIQVIKQARKDLTHLNPDTKGVFKKWVSEIEDFDNNSNGVVSPRNAWDLYREFQDRAYPNAGKKGKIYYPSTEEARIAKRVSEYFREQLGHMDKGLDDALITHSQLHDAESLLKPSTLKEGQTAESIYSAGSSKSDPTRSALLNLGHAVGVGDKYVKEAENIAAMRAFYDEKLGAHGMNGFLHSAVRAVGRPAVKTYESLTQPGLLGEDGLHGYGDSARGLIRGSRMYKDSEKNR